MKVLPHLSRSWVLFVLFLSLLFSLSPAGRVTKEEEDGENPAVVNPQVVKPAANQPVIDQKNADQNPAAGSENPAEANNNKIPEPDPLKRFPLGYEKLTGVTYDSRSLIINGKRELLFCGSIHYPRMRRQKWDDILKKTKEGGINCVQTYVFWNVHEPRRGEFDFSGQNDLVLFIKKIAENGMYCVLRIGPFIQAEWNHGGFPYWLREIPKIVFRTDNPAYKQEMERWTTFICKMMKENKLYANQGGPIILSQIENEYDHVMGAFDESGERYIEWAAKMALSQDTGCPWLMCKQKDAPGQVIDACNGRHCGDTFNGPKNHTKPKLWTENWTAQFRVFGDPPSQRAAEDIARSVLRWFSKNGSHVCYYMYFGGTNFGRTSGAYVTTRYYDEAQIDEFGLLRAPKYGHTRDMHHALSLGKTALLEGSYTVENVNKHVEARIYELPEKHACAAFLWSNSSSHRQKVNFRGTKIVIPPKSTSFLPDCKTVMFNSDMIVAQHSSRKFMKSEIAHRSLNWEMQSEPVPNSGTNFSRQPLEQFFLGKDTTDYVWYITNIELDNNDLPVKKGDVPVLQILSLGHGIIAFVNGELVGNSHGIKRAYHFNYDVPAKMKAGVNEIAFLHYTVGMPDSGAYMEHRFTGLRTLVVQGLATGSLDLTTNGWQHQVGLDGEKLQLYTEEGSKRVEWLPTPKPGVQGPPITWYRAYFDAPDGKEPLAIKMDNMTKGMVWINGNSIGRYWSDFMSSLKRPSQSEYHIPRSFLKPKGNLIVVFDETGGFIETVEILEVNRDQICSWIGENYPPSALSWKLNDKGTEIVQAEEPKTKAELECPHGKVIGAIEYASFGDPIGVCGQYSLSECHAPSSQKVVEKHCLGKRRCKVPVDRKAFDFDGSTCKDVKDDLILAIQAKCQPKPKPTVPEPNPQQPPQPQQPSQPNPQQPPQPQQPSQPKPPQ